MGFIPQEYTNKKGSQVNGEKSFKEANNFKHTVQIILSSQSSPNGSGVEGSVV